MTIYVYCNIYIESRNFGIERLMRMFSSLRLATMRSHKNRARPGSVATSASSDSTRTEETLTQAQPYHPHSFLLPDDQETNIIGALSPLSGVSSKVAQVRVEREDGSLGVTLRGGLSRALVVTGVKADGPAAKEGRVRPGDRLLAVDDTELRGLTLAEAQRALRRTSDTLIASLTIEYDVANMEEARAATSGSLLVQLERGLSGIHCFFFSNVKVFLYLLYLLYFTYKNYEY